MADTSRPIIAPASLQANDHEVAGMAISAAGLAKLLAVSQRHVNALNASGRLPRPIRLVRSVRWLVTELEAWLEAGAPSREEWEKLRQSSSSVPSSPR